MQRIATLSVLLFVPLVLADDLPGRLHWQLSDHDRDLPPDIYRWQPNPLLGAYPWAVEAGHTWRSYELILAGEFVSDTGPHNFDLGPGSGVWLRWWGHRGHECYPMTARWDLEPTEAVGYARMGPGGWCWLRPYPPGAGTTTHWWNLWVDQPHAYPHFVSIPVLYSEVQNRHGELVGAYDDDAIEWVIVPPDWQPGDLNCDGAPYALGDLATLLAHFNDWEQPTYFDGDLDTDGDVDLDDLAAFLERF